MRTILVTMTLHRVGCRHRGRGGGGRCHHHFTISPSHPRNGHSKDNDGNNNDAMQGKGRLQAGQQTPFCHENNTGNDDTTQGRRQSWAG